MVLNNLERAVELLQEQNIDMWLILTREGSDPAVPLLFGVRSVSFAAIMVHSNGKHAVITSKSDVGNYEATGLFSNVICYEKSLAEDFLPIWEEGAYKSVALNISETDLFCDGLTQGLYEWLQQTVGDEEIKKVEVSSESIFAQLKPKQTSYSEITDTNFDVEIQKEKIEQVTTYLMEQNIDAWLIVSRQGEDPSLPLLVGAPLKHMNALIFTKEKNNLVVCSEEDAKTIKKLGLFPTVQTYSNDFDKKLQNIITELSPKTIAMNSSIRENVADGLTAGLFRKVQKILNFEGSYVKSEPFLTKLRAIKSKSEIKRIQRAITVTEEIYEEVYRQLKVGMTEKEAGQLFVDEMKKRGVINGIDRTLSMPIVMKENIAHRAPSDAVIQEGDLVIFDFSVDVDGYVSDIARTVYFLRKDEDSPPKDIQEAFHAVHEAITRAANKIRPGVKGFEVDEAARNYYISNGYPEITHATGHQIGREVHDGGALLAARWERYGDSPYQQLEEGMVFTIEPTLFLDNGIHFIVEENVVITNDSFEYLSKRQNELILIK